MVAKVLFLIVAFSLVPTQEAISIRPGGVHCMSVQDLLSLDNRLAIGISAWQRRLELLESGNICAQTEQQEIVVSIEIVERNGAPLVHNGKLIYCVRMLRWLGCRYVFSDDLETVQ